MAHFDLVITAPKEGLAISVRYRARTMPSPMCRIHCWKVEPEEVRMAAWLTRTRVFKLPAIAARLDVRMEVEPVPCPSCHGQPSQARDPVSASTPVRYSYSSRKGLSAVLARMYCSNPARYSSKWGIRKTRGGVARLLFHRWMLNNIPRADFTVMSRQGAAASIQYVPGESAPKILAMGRGTTGKMILAIAREHGTPCIEDDLCAEMLQERGVPCDPVPEDLWAELIGVMAALAREHNHLRGKWGTAQGINWKDENEGEEWKGGKEPAP